MPETIAAFQYGWLVPLGVTLLFAAVLFGRKGIQLIAGGAVFAATGVILAANWLPIGDWPQTTGTLDSAEVRDGRYVGVQYRYAIDGRLFHGSDYSTPRPLESADWAQSKVDDLHRQAFARDGINVYYDPDDPRRSVLDVGPSRSMAGFGLFFLFFGLLFAFWGLALSATDPGWRTVIGACAAANAVTAALALVISFNEWPVTGWTVGAAWAACLTLGCLVAVSRRGYGHGDPAADHPAPAPSPPVPVRAADAEAELRRQCAQMPKGERIGLTIGFVFIAAFPWGVSAFALWWLYKVFALFSGLPGWIFATLFVPGLLFSGRLLVLTYALTSAAYTVIVGSWLSPPRERRRPR